LDADLIGLTVEHVRQLLQPVIDGESEATVGIFDGGRTSTDWAQALAPCVCGPVAFKHLRAPQANAERGGGGGGGGKK
jgi:hypothetical protein